MFITRWIFFELDLMAFPVFPFEFQSSPADVKDDWQVATSDDEERNKPSSHDKCQNEETSRYVIREIIKTAAGQISLWNVFADAEERKRGESGRIDPNDNDDQVSSRSCRFFGVIQWINDD